MKTRTISVSSLFPAPIDKIWDKLQSLDTLRYIAAPFLSFAPLGGAETVWREGRTARFGLKMFGLIPMGTHTIKVIEFNRDTLAIYTNESNKATPVWNHRILLEKIDDNLTRYTDEVEIGAGRKTAAIALWSKFFYKHRQKKWLNLLR